jgi:hypothetical protein
MLGELVVSPPANTEGVLKADPAPDSVVITSPEVIEEDFSVLEPDVTVLKLLVTSAAVESPASVEEYVPEILVCVETELILEGWALRYVSFIEDELLMVESAVAVE